MSKLNQAAIKETAKIVGFAMIAIVVGITIALYVPMNIVMAFLGIGCIALVIKVIYDYQVLKTEFKNSDISAN